MLLQGILRRAVVHGLIPANPVQQVAKPKQISTEAPNPLSPEQVERIRLYLLTRSWSSEKRGTGRSPWNLEWWRQRNALIVSLLAYAGFRPSEDRSLVWSDLRGNLLHVVATKTNRPRQVDVLEPLAKELAEWQLLSGRPTGRQLIIPRTVPGRWTKNDWDNWRERVYRPAAKFVLGPDADGSHPYRPYRLRSSFVSLLLWAGEDLPYVADQAGHSVATLARHYAGVLRELRGKPRVPAAEAIREARASIGTELTGSPVSRERVPDGTQIGRNAEAGA
jgi:integrase